MIVPRYWAEARVQAQRDRRQITVRRFGWSDDSEADARASAPSRGASALISICDREPICRMLWHGRARQRRDQ